MSKLSHSHQPTMDAPDTTAKHTPTPWYSGIWSGEPEIIEVWSSEPTPVGSDRIDIASVNVWKDAPEESAANADFICKAVNNHETLLEALRAITEHFADVMGGPQMSHIKFQNGVEGIPTIAKARAAITKATGGQ